MSARNVINVAALDAFLADLANDSDDDAIADWLTRSARRWLLANYDQFWLVSREPITDRLVLLDPAEDGRVIAAYEDDVPDWAMRAIALGEPLHHLRLNRTLIKRLRRIMVWAESTAEPNKGPRLARMGFADAEAQATRWWRAKYTRPVWPDGVEPVFERAGETVVRLTSESALVEEGDAMDHCVGGYTWVVREGLCEIYSLRDADREPQATVEVCPANGVVLQVKGPSNGPVSEGYRPTLNAFISRRGWRVEGDHHNLRLHRQVPQEDPDALRHYLTSDQGRAHLKDLRYVAMDDMVAGSDSRFVQMLGHGLYHLNKKQRRRAFRLIFPEGPPILFRVRASRWVYGELWPVMAVCAPLPLLSLIDHVEFGIEDQDDRAAELRRRLAALVPMLAFQEPDRLFDLGPDAVSGNFYSVAAEGPARLFDNGDFDMTALREKRHLRIRQRLNAAKRRAVGRWAARSETHQALRHLLSGEAGRYIV